MASNAEVVNIFSQRFQEVGVNIHMYNDQAIDNNYVSWKEVLTIYMGIKSTNPDPYKPLNSRAKSNIWEMKNPFGWMHKESGLNTKFWDFYLVYCA